MRRAQSVLALLAIACASAACTTTRVLKPETARTVDPENARVLVLPVDVEVASLLGCAVGPDVAEARERLKPGVALYAGFFPRYNRVLAESGFAEAAADMRAAWQRGDRAGAARLVPDALVDAVALVGPPARCRERIAQYREAGVGLPIVTPRVRDGGGVASVQEAIRACAPTP